MIRAPARRSPARGAALALLVAGLLSCAAEKGAGALRFHAIGLEYDKSRYSVCPGDQKAGEYLAVLGDEGSPLYRPLFMWAGNRSGSLFGFDPASDEFKGNFECLKAKKGSPIYLLRVAATIYDGRPASQVTEVIKWKSAAASSKPIEGFVLDLGDYSSLVEVYPGYEVWSFACSAAGDYYVIQSRLDDGDAEGRQGFVAMLKSLKIAQ